MVDGTPAPTSPSERRGPPYLTRDSAKILYGRLPRNGVVPEMRVLR